MRHNEMPVNVASAPQAHAAVGDMYCKLVQVFMVKLEQATNPLVSPAGAEVSKIYGMSPDVVTVAKVPRHPGPTPFPSCELSSCKIW